MYQHSWISKLRIVPLIKKIQILSPVEASEDLEPSIKKQLEKVNPERDYQTEICKKSAIVRRFR